MTMSLYRLLTDARTEKCSSCCCSSRFSCVVLESWRALGRKGGGGGGGEHELPHVRIRLLVALARKMKEMLEEEEDDDVEEEKEVCLKGKEKEGRGSDGRK